MPESTDANRELARGLDALFAGVDAGLRSLREVRSIYDAEVAFDFNPLRLFNINENTVSSMLAYFLDSAAAHGQKDAFLRVFLDMIDVEDKRALESLDRADEVSVDAQYRTVKGRPIDIVIRFGNNQFLLGVENKVWGAVDQPEQLRDYIADIDVKSNGRFLMLYMSPHGEGPSGNSILASELDVLGSKFKIIPFNRDSGLAVVPILKAWEGVCRADSVRAFLRFMVKYLREHFMGDKTMDESAFLIDYLRHHPDAFAVVPGLNGACETLRLRVRQAFCIVVERELYGRGIEVTHDWPLLRRDADVCHRESPIPHGIEVSPDGGEIGLPFARDKLPSLGLDESMLEPFIKAMKGHYQDLGTNDVWMGGFTAIPALLKELTDDDVVAVLKEDRAVFEDSNHLRRKAEPLVGFVAQYVNCAEAEWRRAGLPSAVPNAAELGATPA